MSFGSSGSGDFDFGAQMQSGEAWSPPLQEILPKGNYVVKIAEATKGKSSGGFPQIELRLENEQGAIRDWVTISPTEFAISKLLGLIDGTGLRRPKAGTEVAEQTGELSTPYVESLVGRQVGVVIRDEEDNRPDHAGEMRPRIQGYTTPEQITKAGGSNGGAPPSGPVTGPSQAQSGLAF